MPSISSKLTVLAVLVLALSTGANAAIECNQLQTKFNSVFQEPGGRVKKAIADGEALPKNAPKEQQSALELKFCMAASEIIGMYALLRAMTVQCAAAGEQVGDAIQFFDKELNSTRDLISDCGK